MQILGLQEQHLHLGLPIRAWRSVVMLSISVLYCLALLPSLVAQQYWNRTAVILTSMPTPTLTSVVTPLSGSLVYGKQKLICRSLRGAYICRQQLLSQRTPRSLLRGGRRG